MNISGLTLVGAVRPRAVSGGDDDRVRDMIASAHLVPYRKFEQAADFRLVDVRSGRLVSFRQSFASRVVLINVWATWCGPCVREMPSLQALHNALRDESFSVLGVNDESLAKQRYFVEQHNIVFPCVGGSLDDLKFVQGSRVPESYLLDRRGRVVAFKAGSHEWVTAAMQNLIRFLASRSVE